MDNSAAHGRPVIYTVGHSNHTASTFLDLLISHEIEVLVDVRSQPYSRYAPQFERLQLKAAVTATGLSYLFLGKELGGRPDGAEFYDPDGRVEYERVSESPLFKQGVERLQHGITKYKVAIMCAEEDPAHCHRRLLVSRVLAEQDIEIRHIRGDGHIEIEQAYGDCATPSGQLALFPSEETKAEWKSTRSVLRRDPRQTSSEH